MERSIHARRQRGKRWNRIYSDGARSAGSLQDAHTGNDARLMVMHRSLPPLGHRAKAHQHAELAANTGRANTTKTRRTSSGGPSTDALRRLGRRRDTATSFVYGRAHIAAESSVNPLTEGARLIAS
jgi:hypothetical protein